MHFSCISCVPIIFVTLPRFSRVMQVILFANGGGRVPLNPRFFRVLDHVMILHVVVVHHFIFRDVPNLPFFQRFPCFFISFINFHQLHNLSALHRFHKPSFLIILRNILSFIMFIFSKHIDFFLHLHLFSIIFCFYQVSFSSLLIMFRKLS